MSAAASTVDTGAKSCTCWIAHTPKTAIVKGTVNLPALADDEVEVKMLCSGVCASDVDALDKTVRKIIAIKSFTNNAHIRRIRSHSHAFTQSSSSSHLFSVDLLVCFLYLISAGHVFQVSNGCWS